MLKEKYLTVGTDRLLFLFKGKLESMNNATGADKEAYFQDLLAITEELKMRGKL